ncbi:MAG: RNHCP domain-containing protein [Thermomicrobiales bacterium]
MKHQYDDDDFDFNDNGEKHRRLFSRKADGGTSRNAKKQLREPRNDSDQAFKCGHCKQFIGAPIMGGRQRNHCPNCLYSKHVDHSRPGDRRSTCQSIMKPMGIVHRRNEDVLIHLCLGCGKEDPNRIAADDNPVLLDEMPIIEWNEFSLGSADVFDKMS